MRWVAHANSDANTNAGWDADTHADAHSDADTNTDAHAGFKIERCQGNGCSSFAEIAQVGPNVSSFSNTGLSSNTRYRYRVRAFNGGGNSAYSNIAGVRTFR